MAGDISQVTPNSVVELLTNLQNLFMQDNCSAKPRLPVIAVVGDGRSTGSLLNRWLEWDIWPSSDGFVQIHPVLLRPQFGQNKSAEFTHIPGSCFTIGDDIKKEIISVTTGKQQRKLRSSDNLITITVQSPNVSNLGMMYISEGCRATDSDADSHTRSGLSDSTMDIIMQRACVLLVTLPGHLDFRSSAALDLARAIDPAGIRTVIAIIQTTVLGFSNSSLAALKAESSPGIGRCAGVVGRDLLSAEIDSVEHKRESERQFFKFHPALGHVAGRMGIMQLHYLVECELTRVTTTALSSVTHDLQRYAANASRGVKEISRTTLNQTIRALQRFSEDFELSVASSGRGGANVSTDELSAGVRIRLIFHNKFPQEMARIEFDETKLRKEIAFAICNIRAIRPGLFTPDMAFEAVVKQQINHLKQPSLQCVDHVAQELSAAIDKCSNHVTVHPGLRRQVLSMANRFIQDRAEEVKEQISLRLGCELAYMNTNHEDFVGFVHPEANSDHIPRLSFNVSTPVMHRGLLKVSNLGILRGGPRNYWFVLTAESISWFKKENKEVMKHTLTLKDLKFRDFKTEPGKPQKKETSFVLFSPGRKNLYKSLGHLELTCQSAEDLDQWRCALARAGVHREQGTSACSIDVSPELPLSLPHAHLERQVESVRKLVTSYMQIVRKTVRDLVPKASVCLLINKVRRFLAEDLLVQLCTSTDQIRAGETEAEANRLCRRGRVYEQALAMIKAARIVPATSQVDSPFELTPSIQTSIVTPVV